MNDDHLRARTVGALERHHGPDDPQLRRELRAAKLAEHVRKVVATAPPLSAEQIEQLRGLLPYPHPSGDREATLA